MRTPQVAADEEASFLTGCIDHSSRMLQSLATNVLLAQRAQQQSAAPAGAGGSQLAPARPARSVNVARLMDNLVDMCSLSCAHRTNITWEWLGEPLFHNVIVDEQSLVQVCTLHAQTGPATQSQSPVPPATDRGLVSFSFPAGSPA